MRHRCPVDLDKDVAWQIATYVEVDGAIESADVVPRSVELVEEARRIAVCIHYARVDLVRHEGDVPIERITEATVEAYPVTFVQRTCNAFLRRDSSLGERAGEERPTLDAHCSEVRGARLMPSDEWAVPLIPAEQLVAAVAAQDDLHVPARELRDQERRDAGRVAERFVEGVRDAFHVPPTSMSICSSW